MAPIHHDLSTLSPRHRAILAAGVRGGDGPEDEETPAEAPPAEAPAEETPGEGGDGEETPGEGDGEGEGAPSAMIPPLPEDLTVVPVEQLIELHAEIGEVRSGIQQSARTQADLDAIREATAARQTINGEIRRRVDEARTVQEGLAALNEELASEEPLPEPEFAIASATPRPPTAAQVASARGVQPPAAQNPTPTRERPRAALVAAVGGDRAQVGQTVTDDDLGEILDRTKNSEARTIVASLPAYTEMRGDVGPILGTGSTEQNTELMREIREAFAAARRGEPLDARMAAICEPLDVRRDIPDAFNTSEPIRGIFPNSPATRLGFQYFRSVGLSDVSGAVTLWDETDQAAVTSTEGTWKPCLEIDCPTAQSIKAEAVVACLLWDNTMEMSNPENLANLRNALNALRARMKEGRILQLLDASAHHYTHDADYGAVPTLIEALNTTMAIGGYTNRLDDESYTAILPPGAVGVLMTDMASRGFEGVNVTDALGYVRDRVAGVGSVVMSLDASLAGEPSLPFPTLNPVGQAAVALPSINDTYRVRLLDPAGYVYSETGQLNMGTTTDARLLRMNKTQFFQEEYLLLAKQGPQPSFAVDVDLCANGARAGWVTPFTCQFS